MTKQTELIMEAYELIENITPLKFDCGTLCGAYCCQNNGKDGETLGMWLLPFEREVLKNQKGFTFSSASDTETVFCKGICNRKYRPFACRIYPYYAHIGTLPGGRTKITLKIDPRAKFSCPIAFSNSYLRPSIEFISHAKAAIRILMKDEALKKDIIDISEFLSEIEEMQEMLCK